MKKKLAVLVLCLISFMCGFIMHFIYSKLEPSSNTKRMQRKELRKTLSVVSGKLSDISTIEEEDMGSYTRRYLRFQWQGFSCEAFLLIPHGSKDKMAAILALPGHHTTKEEVIGETPSPYGVDYGLKLVKSGFCILAPDIPFSEDMRVEDHVALKLIMAGSSLTGLRVSYLTALIDYLSSFPFIDSERLGCVGWSMGGGLAMYLAAVDKRVKVVAISRYFGTYRDTLMRIRQSTDNYIPGILKFGDMADVACLIAPRPLLIEGGDRDPEFPKEAFERGIEDLRRCYKGCEECLQWQVIPGGHKFQGTGVSEWFEKWL